MKGGYYGHSVMIEECLSVEVRVTGDGCPLAAATDRVDASVEAAPPLLRPDGNALLRFTAPASDGLARTLDADDRVRYLHRSRGEERDEYRCLSLDPCVVHELTDAGFMAEALTYADGVERYDGTVVGEEVLRGVLATAGDRVGVTLERVYPLGPGAEPGTGRWNVTAPQAEALRTALRMGYFTVPREATAGEVAAELGIGKSAFLERFRRGLSGLLAQVFETGGHGPDGGAGR